MLNLCYPEEQSQVIIFTSSLEQDLISCWSSHSMILYLFCINRSIELQCPKFRFPADASAELKHLICNPYSNLLHVNSYFKKKTANVWIDTETNCFTGGAAITRADGEKEQIGITISIFQLLQSSVCSSVPPFLHPISHWNSSDMYTFYIWFISNPKLCSSGACVLRVYLLPPTRIK